MALLCSQHDVKLLAGLRAAGRGRREAVPSARGCGTVWFPAAAGASPPPYPLEWPRCPPCRGLCGPVSCTPVSFLSAPAPGCEPRREGSPAGAAQCRRWGPGVPPRPVQEHVGSRPPGPARALLGAAPWRAAMPAGPARHDPRERLLVASGAAGTQAWGWHLDWLTAGRAG